jgi:hypothetical protein
MRRTDVGLYLLRGDYMAQLNYIAHAQASRLDVKKRPCPCGSVLSDGAFAPFDPVIAQVCSAVCSHDVTEHAAGTP